MIRISTTTLESYRAVLQEVYGNERELAETIRGRPFEPRWQMEAGAAWQELLEGEGQPPTARKAMCKRKTDSGNVFWLETEARQRAAVDSAASGLDVVAFQCEVCDLWHIGKPTGKESQPDRVLSGAYSFSAEAMAIAKRVLGPGLCEVKATRTWKIDGRDVMVVAKVDHARGLVLQENKAKFSPADPSDYEPSLQWRFYLAVHEAACLRYNLFSFRDPTDDGYCELKDVLSFKFWPYRELEADCRSWLGMFLDWTDRNELTSYLTR